MRKSRKIMTAFLVVAPLILAPVGAQASTSVDKEALQYMVAEEKLAHDVYVTLGGAFSLRVFDKIARAELTHMSAVRGLLETYGITDPTVGDKVGEFDDPTLQALYDSLVKEGLESRTAALEVGVTIEEMDIADLKAFLNENTAVDVERVLNSLLRGSQRHLNAFENNLGR